MAFTHFHTRIGFPGTKSTSRRDGLILYLGPVNKADTSIDFLVRNWYAVYMSSEIYFKSEKMAQKAQDAVSCAAVELGATTDDLTEFVPQFRYGWCIVLAEEVLEKWPSLAAVAARCSGKS
jgi:hypothetical protein